MKKSRSGFCSQTCTIIVAIKMLWTLDNQRPLRCICIYIWMCVVVDYFSIHCNSKKYKHNTLSSISANAMMRIYMPSCFSKWQIQLHIHNHTHTSASLSACVVVCYLFKCQWSEAHPPQTFNLTNWKHFVKLLTRCKHSINQATNALQESGNQGIRKSKSQN